MDLPGAVAIDYPEGPRNRLTVFLRIILALPILSIVMLIDGSIPLGQLDPYWTFAELELLLMGLGLHLATTLMILFRRKYPRWWFATGQYGGYALTVRRHVGRG